MYYNLFIKQLPSGRCHYLGWDEYRTKKAARNAIRCYDKRYYTYVKTISVSPNFVPDDDTTMERFPVSSYNYGRITYDR